MATKLVIVESPAKAKTINKFLGEDYKISASFGHVRDLPKKTLGVDLENNFTPKYEIMPDKREIVSKLRKEAKEYEKIYLATDPDREGEAISWHLAHILDINEKENCRITFNEITRKAVQSAIEASRPIDAGMVDSQQARRILDRIVGYKISPLLWKKVKKGLSAGRVQSVAVRLICEREREIDGFRPVEYWNLNIVLSKKGEKETFTARYYGDSDGRRKLEKEADVAEAMAKFEGKPVVVRNVKKSEKKKYPYPPFTTSTLQQEASNKLGFPTKKTMSVAQQLYEGVNVGDSGSIGLITYMRTDSTRVSAEIQNEARDLILKMFGADYFPTAKNTYVNKGKTQDAHEAVRPTNLAFLPHEIKESLTGDQYKLYKLIFDRFVASQMSPAISDNVNVDFESGGQIFKAMGSVVVFKGFLAVYEATAGIQNDEEETIVNAYMPELSKNEEVVLKDISKEQKFTQPPARYTEASLVKTMEEKGIGRPSTYSPTISTIISREYVERQKKSLAPTELGKIVNEIMENNFTHIVDYNFTADMENKLDDIEQGGTDMNSVLSDFYNEFSEILDNAYKTLEKVAMPVEETDIICEKCGRNMVVKTGRYGKFIACPGYPECKNIKPYIEDTGKICPKCGGRVVYKTTRKNKKFIGCENYPACDFSSWNLPTDGNCPKCGTFLTKGRIDYKPHIVCPNPACDYKEQIVKGGK
ncbi:MAG: type I DNA topoisomerase [Clostridia bacterium]|nr:type I DNA topoisomerase [Clostridia bacterium]